MVASWAVLPLALFVLVLAGRWTIRLLTYATSAFGISEFSVAFIFLAVATSVPELFVSISSALQNAGPIVIAVALGSNVVNMTLIVGLAAVVSAGISTASLQLRRDILLSGAITVLPMLLLLDGIISRLEGFALLLIFGIYMLVVYRDRGRYTTPHRQRRVIQGIGMLLGALLLVAIVIVSADMTVSSSINLARVVALPEFIIGLIILAIGTSLPELTTTVSAALQRKQTMALGNIIGSNVADSALIIGLASTIRPLAVPLDIPLIITAVSVLIALALLGYFVTTRQRLSVAEGLLLMLTFFFFATTAIISSVPTTLHR